LREALATPGPVVVEATVDPNEPPLPPKTTFEFGKNFAEALARGTKSAGKIMGNVAREKVRELI
jgi:pyruvate dehydrogenase (quinone)/pyruvate oxidase